MIRRGMTIIELMVAGAMLCTLLAVCVQMVAAVAAQRRAVDQREYATIELANVMERITARPWDELTSQAVAHEQPSPAALSRLPGAELKVEVTAPAGEPDAKRIAAALRWQDRNGAFLPPLTVTTWKYRQ